MYKKSDFKIGETLYCAVKKRVHMSYEIVQYKIQKIGNIYMEIDSYGRVVIKSLDMIETIYDSGKAFKSFQEAENFIFEDKVRREIREHLTDHRFLNKFYGDKLLELKKLIEEVKK